MQEIFNQTLDALLIEPPSSIAVAISGGADSYALLHLTQQWAVQNKITLHAMTVDHRLRPESTAEAEHVALWCKQNKIPHTILPWLDDKPSTGIQDAARDKRQELLFDSCREKNIPVLMMAHHADDQAETFLMRLQRGSGLTGLTGIPPYRYDSETNILLLRPLLGLRRQILRDYAVKFDLPFMDDPSNDNAQFERVAVRQLLAQLPDLADGVIKSVERLTNADQALTDLALKQFQLHYKIVGDAIWLPSSLFLDTENALSARLLEQTFHIVDESIFIPLTGLENLVLNLNDPDFKGQTLAGIQIRPKIHNKEQGFLFTSEPARRHNF